MGWDMGFYCVFAWDGFLYDRRGQGAMFVGRPTTLFSSLFDYIKWNTQGGGWRCEMILC